LTVYGTDGEVVIDNNLKTFRTSTFDDTTATGIIKESVSQASQQLFGVVENALGLAKRVAYRKMDDPRGEESDSHYVLIDKYLNSIQTDTKPPVTLAEGTDTIRVLEAIENMN
jgi:predicted dehydrogenase